MKIQIMLFILLLSITVKGQQALVTYAGNGGKETFHDVFQLSDGTFLVAGYAENLDWINNTPAVELSYIGTINNAQGTNRFGILLHLSNDLQHIYEVVHFPQGAVEDIRFIKTNSLPYNVTGDLFISCNTADTDNNNGGYLLAKLDNNFINGIPQSLEWHRAVWAKSGPKDYHPWDVTNDGRVYYVSGEAHGYDWSAMYCLDQSGNRIPVENWRTHWLSNGSEWRGTPASSNPNGGIGAVSYSGIVFKVGGRCDLRSWNSEDFNVTQEDGNGGTKKGKWPADFLFNSPCDPATPTANGPGYNGYSSESCCPVWGASCLTIDRMSNHVYLGINFKSYYEPGSTPDFEPAVIAFDDQGTLQWWSRLYHEITPEGDTVGSIPDQYIDALSIDYSQQKLVVGARCHGNNTENLWEGNTLFYSPNASGFQNRFTGTQGDIHISWLGKLDLENGHITASTYMAELSEGTGSLGSPHSDPNLDGWPDPNTGWPNVNTTRMARNSMKATSTGDVVVIAQGRRTITTSNAYQKMVKPYYGGSSAWNSFVRVYEDDLSKPLYSSLVVGEWDTLTQVGGGNIELFGAYKTTTGVIAVGKHTADALGVANGNSIPVTNVPSWGSSSPQNESAVLVYYPASNLYEPTDSTQNGTNNIAYDSTKGLTIYPNPAQEFVYLNWSSQTQDRPTAIEIFDIAGKLVFHQPYIQPEISITDLPNGIYELVLVSKQNRWANKLVISKN
jgi:hypothetical protein